MQWPPKESVLYSKCNLGPSGGSKKKVAGSSGIIHWKIRILSLRDKTEDCIHEREC